MDRPSSERACSTTGGRAQGPAIWSAAKKKLRASIGEAEYAKWIDDIRFVAEVDASMVVAVRDRYAFDRVTAAYRRDIVAGWQAVDPQRRTPRLVCWALAADDLKALAPDPWAAKAAPVESDASHMRFETLVEGGSNTVAARLARRIAAGEPVPSRLFLLSGPQGVGKTHLLRSMAAEATGAKVVYMSAEEFMSAYVEGAIKRDTTNLKARARQCDVLAIDDIQVIAGRPGTDRELLNTLRAVTGAGGIVIATADTPLAALNGLSSRMREELAGAAAVQIDLPDDDMRREIVGVHAELVAGANPDFRLSEEMRDLIVRRVRGPGRALSGAVKSLYFETGFGEREATPAMLDGVISRQQGERRPPSIDMVKRAAMRAFQVTRSDLESPRKHHAIVYPRQIAMYLCRELTTKSLPQIGHSFGRRDHTTVLYAHRKIAKRLSDDPDLAAEVRRVAAIVDHIQAEG